MHRSIWPKAAIIVLLFAVAFTFAAGSLPVRFTRLTGAAEVGAAEAGVEEVGEEVVGVEVGEAVGVAVGVDIAVATLTGTTHIIPVTTAVTGTILSVPIPTITEPTRIHTTMVTPRIRRLSIS